MSTLVKEKVLPVNAFEKWLTLQPRALAVQYVIQCLMQPDRGELAWEFMERHFGKGWKCEGSELAEKIAEAIESIQPAEAG